jgi:hypothetical protein
VPESYEVDAAVAAATNAVEVEAVVAEGGGGRVFVERAGIDGARGGEAGACGVREE